MNTYRFRAIPRIATAFSYRGLPQVTTQSLGQLLVGVTVHQLTGTPSVGYDIHLQLDRQSHHDALTEIYFAMQQLGLTVTQAVITEWVTSVVEGALVGATGGGAIGASAKDPWAILLGGAVGFFVGAAAGSLIKTAKATHDARLVHSFNGGQWRIERAPPSPATSWAPSRYFQ
jgi:hypothetical protein